MQFSWFALYDANALVGCSRPFLYLLSIVLLFFYHQCFENTLWLVDVERAQNASRKKITLRFKQESTKYLLKSESVEFERFEMPFFNAVFEVIKVIRLSCCHDFPAWARVSALSEKF